MEAFPAGSVRSLRTVSSLFSTSSATPVVVGSGGDQMRLSFNSGNYKAMRVIAQFSNIQQIATNYCSTKIYINANSTVLATQETGGILLNTHALSREFMGVVPVASNAPYDIRGMMSTSDATCTAVLDVFSYVERSLIVTGYSGSCSNYAQYSFYQAASGFSLSNPDGLWIHWLPHTPLLLQLNGTSDVLITVEISHISTDTFPRFKLMLGSETYFNIYTLRNYRLSSNEHFHPIVLVGVLKNVAPVKTNITIQAEYSSLSISVGMQTRIFAQVSPISCFGIQSDNTSVCSKNGNCTLPDVCTCKPGYSGVQCQTWFCGEKNNTDPNVCSSHGTCSASETCTCNMFYYGNTCNTTTCMGTPSNQSNVCSSHGSCYEFNICTCNVGYTNSDCSQTSCYGIPSQMSNVCSFHGNCVSYNNCSCNAGWGLLNCSAAICFGKMATNGAVCSSHGSCSAPDTCNCNFGYDGGQCQNTVCFSLNHTNPLVCSGHGACIKPNNCSCSVGYVSSNCELATCFGKNSSDSQVCSNRGTCLSPDNCQCISGWTGANCSIPTCSGISALMPTVCSGKGSCVSNNTCVCNNGYTGDICQLSICNGLNSSNPAVCGGAGTCTAPDVCTCFSTCNVGLFCEYDRCQPLNLTANLTSGYANQLHYVKLTINTTIPLYIQQQLVCALVIGASTIAYPISLVVNSTGNYEYRCTLFSTAQQAGQFSLLYTGLPLSTSVVVFEYLDFVNLTFTHDSVVALSHNSNSPKVYNFTTSKPFYSTSALYCKQSNNADYIAVLAISSNTFRCNFSLVGASAQLYYMTLYYWSPVFGYLNVTNTMLPLQFVGMDNLLLGTTVSNNAFDLNSAIVVNVTLAVSYFMHESIKPRIFCKYNTIPYPVSSYYGNSYLCNIANSENQGFREIALYVDNYYTNVPISNNVNIFVRKTPTIVQGSNQVHFRQGSNATITLDVNQDITLSPSDSLAYVCGYYSNSNLVLGQVAKQSDTRFVCSIASPAVASVVQLKLYYLLSKSNIYVPMTNEIPIYFWGNYTPVTVSPIAQFYAGNGNGITTSISISYNVPFLSPIQVVCYATIRSMPLSATATVADGNSVTCSFTVGFALSGIEVGVIQIRTLNTGFNISTNDAYSLAVPTIAPSTNAFLPTNKTNMFNFNVNGVNPEMNFTIRPYFLQNGTSYNLNCLDSNSTTPISCSIPTNTSFAKNPVVLNFKFAISNYGSELVFNASEAFFATVFKTTQEYPFILDMYSPARFVAITTTPQPNPQFQFRANTSFVPSTRNVLITDAGFNVSYSVSNNTEGIHHIYFYWHASSSLFINLTDAVPASIVATSIAPTPLVFPATGTASFSFKATSNNAILPFSRYPLLQHSLSAFPQWPCSITSSFNLTCYKTHDVNIGNLLFSQQTTSINTTGYDTPLIALNKHFVFYNTLGYLNPSQYGTVVNTKVIMALFAINVTLNANASFAPIQPSFFVKLAQHANITIPAIQSGNTTLRFNISSSLLSTSQYYNISVFFSSVYTGPELIELTVPQNLPTIFAIQSGPIYAESMASKSYLHIASTNVMFEYALSMHIPSHLHSHVKCRLYNQLASASITNDRVSCQMNSPYAATIMLEFLYTEANTTLQLNTAPYFYTFVTKVDSPYFERAGGIANNTYTVTLIHSSNFIPLLKNVTYFVRGTGKSSNITRQFDASVETTRRFTFQFYHDRNETMDVILFVKYQNESLPITDAVEYFWLNSFFLEPTYGLRSGGQIVVINNYTLAEGNVTFKNDAISFNCQKLGTILSCTTPILNALKLPFSSHEIEVNSQPLALSYVIYEERVITPTFPTVLPNSAYVNMTFTTNLQLRVQSGTIEVSVNVGSSTYSLQSFEPKLNSGLFYANNVSFAARVEPYYMLLQYKEFNLLLLNNSRLTISQAVPVFFLPTDAIEFQSSNIYSVDTTAKLRISYPIGIHGSLASSVSCVANGTAVTTTAITNSTFECNITSANEGVVFVNLEYRGANAYNGGVKLGVAPLPVLFVSPAPISLSPHASINAGQRVNISGSASWSMFAPYTSAYCKSINNGILFDASAYTLPGYYYCDFKPNGTHVMDKIELWLRTSNGYAFVYFLLFLVN